MNHATVINYNKGMAIDIRWIFVNNSQVVNEFAPPIERAIFI